MLLKSVFVISVCVCVNSRLDFNVDPMLRYNTTELIKNAGFDFERYTTTTADGYILPLFRIVRVLGAGEPGPPRYGPPVLLMHGMLTASDSWLLKGRERDLAFMMADAGYDVWLSDFRGDVYTRKHVSMSPNDPAFWQFSFHEMGVYDLPAMIEKILETSGHEQLSYVCHSMGCTAFFVMGSHYPDITAKARVMVAMAPAANWYPENATPAQRALINLGELVAKSFLRQKQYEVLQRVWFAPIFAHTLCGPAAATQDICYDLLFFWAGSAAHRIARIVLPRALSHSPAGSGLFVPLQIIQSTKGVFAPFDFGEQMNQRKYGVVKPERYNISRVLCPVSVHYSTADGLINPKDVRENLKLLSHLVDVQEYPDQSHVDYVWGADAWKQVYPRIIATLDKLNNPPYR